jgi:hypothetical protein
MKGSALRYPHMALTTDDVRAAAFGRKLTLPLPWEQGGFMFRALVVSTVLALTVWQNAMLTCLAWCESEAATADCHHHQEESAARPASMVTNQDCEQMGLDGRAFLREEKRRTIATSEAVAAVLVRDLRLAHLTPLARPEQQPGRDRSFESRPLTPALRI